MKKIWIISDTHFNHKTMIKEKWRDFYSIFHMNRKIMDNWNRLVSNKDLVYHLGDVCISQKEKFMKEILPKLNGEIIFIRGNHDSKSFSNIKNLIIDYKGKVIELVHDPNDATLTTDYIIHGHLHKSGNHDITKVDKIKYYNANIEFQKYKPKLLCEIIGELDKYILREKR